MITVHNASFHLNNMEILHSICLNLHPGSAHLLTGHNGCGKTMLLRLLAGLIRPTSGEIVFSKRPSYGVIIENPSFLMHESAYYNLKFLADINRKIGKQTIDAYLKHFGLYDMRNKKVKALSLGMRQRLALAQAFMENPNILLLDEPFNALDKQYRALLLEDLFSAKESGKTIVIASHGDTEADSNIYDQIHIMENGTIVQN